jgi:hypothetical protein
MRSVVFPKTVVKIIAKFVYIMGNSCANLRLFFSTKCSSLSTSFPNLTPTPLPTFAWEAVCWSSKTLSWSVGTLYVGALYVGVLYVGAVYALRASACHFPQNVIVRTCASGAQKHGSLRVLNRGSGGMKENSPPHCCKCLLHAQTGVCDLTLSCSRRTWYITYCWGEDLKLVVINLFNVCTYCYEFNLALFHYSFLAP